MTTEYVPSQFQGNPTVAQLNAEFVRIRNALDNTFSRVQGVLGSEVPFINQLELDLDLNDHELLNVRTNPEDPNSLARIADIPSGLTVEELTDQTVVLIAQVNALQSEIDNLPDGTLNSASQAELDSLTTIVTGISNQINTLGNSLGDISALVGSQGQTLDQLGAEFGVQVNAINQNILALQNTVANLPTGNTDGVSQADFDVLANEFGVQVNAINQSILALQTMIDNLPAPNTDVVSQADFDVLSGEFGTQVNAINQSIASLQTMIDNLPPSGVSQSDFDVLANEFGTQVNAINQSILDLENTIANLPAPNTDVVSQTVFDTQVDAINQSITALQTMLANLPSDNVSQADFDVLVGEFGTQVNAINQSILALQTTVDGLPTDIDIQINSINQSIQSLQTTVDNLPTDGVSQADFDVLAGEFGTQVNAINQSILAVQTSVDDLPASIRQQQRAFSFDGLLPDGEVAAQWVEGIGFNIEENVTTGFIVAGTGPTVGSATLSISFESGGSFVQVGIASIQTGSTTGTVSFLGTHTIAPGTLIRITAANQNGAEDIALTFVFNQE